MSRTDAKLVFEKGSSGRCAVRPSSHDVPRAEAEKLIPKSLLRDDIEDFPEVSEGELMRHYTELAHLNFGVETGFYPLGSCTMKYNPKINELAARLEGFAGLHPYAPEAMSQGSLELIASLENYLCEITGMTEVTLQPAAGAQGELCGMLMIRACLDEKGSNRDKVLIPDTAHGTNPASCHQAGFKVVRIESRGDGILTPEEVKKAVGEDTAALMLTNPNTLGLFEENIKEIADIVHDSGGFVYCDGANMNALMGIMKLGEMGIDVVQLNLHKTFSTPHGGGGPGSGPLGVTSELAPYLPVPRVREKGGSFSLDYEAPKSIGRLKAFYGNFSVMVKAYTYIRMMGALGLRRAGEVAILNANYIKEKLKDSFHLPFDKVCMHECVFTDKLQSSHDVTTLDIAKRLIDYGIHPPTIYFPLVVSGAMMVEPTETESPETIDDFIEAMKSIADEAKENPSLLKNAPVNAPVARVDETTAARRPMLRWERG